MGAWVTSPNYAVVAQLLADLRRASGLSQAALAERLGKPPSHIAKIELRERRLDVVEFVAILRALGTDEEEAWRQLRARLLFDDHARPGQTD